MSQVSDSDTSSIGSSDLQEGLDFWAPSTYFWALEGWEKFCLSAVSQMRAACMWPTQLHPTDSIFKCSENVQRSLEIAVLNKLIMIALKTLLHAQL